MATAANPEANGTADAQAKPPFLRRVRIRGYKSIAFCDVTLEPLTILVGRNASGKSNFLDALEFLRDAMSVSVTEAARLHGGEALKCRTTSHADIEIVLDIDYLSRGMLWRAKYEVTLVPKARGLMEIRREQFHTYDLERKQENGYRIEDGELFFRHFDLANGAQTETSKGAITSDRLLLGAFVSPPNADLSDGLRYSGFYNFHPDSMRLLQRPDLGALLNRDGRNIASVLENVKNADQDTMNRIRAYLSAVVEEVETLEVVQYGEYETVRFGMCRGKHARVVDFDAASMSDGTLRALAALVAAFQIHFPTGPSIVAIEEPETSLHPAAMRALVDALDEATLRTQILLTTHSAEMLDNPTIKPENIRVVQMIDGQTRIAPVDAGSVDIVRRNLNTLGGLERDNLLEPDLDDLERQQRLAEAQEGTP